MSSEQFPKSLVETSELFRLPLKGFVLEFLMTGFHHKPRGFLLMACAASSLASCASLGRIGRTDISNSPIQTKELSWTIDKAHFASEFRYDLDAICTRQNVLLLLAAGGASFAIHETLDDDIADNTTDHANRWGSAQDFFGPIGNPVLHLAAISGLYAYSLVQQDVEVHELSKSLFNSVAITGLSTTVLKYAANSTRPNGDPYGWPSGHTSSSVAIATVLDAYFGHPVGIPAFALAGLVAWERIDDREHDLSDVVFAAAMGYVVGRSVATSHQANFCGLHVEPYTDPATGAVGIALERQF